MNELMKLKQAGDVDEEAGKQIVLEAYEFWSTATGSGFAAQCKELFNRMDCMSSDVGLLAFAIFKGVKIARFNSSGMREAFGELRKEDRQLSA